MRLLRRAHACAVAAFLVPTLAGASGYAIYEQGAAALGMGGAFVASVHDASAQFFNPAALPRLEGSQLSFGGSWLSTRTSFAGVDPFPGFGTTEEMKTGNFFPPMLYWTRHLGSRAALGVGVNSPFGLGIDWQSPETFSGRERATKASIQTINSSLSLAYALGDRWSVAAGASALFAKVELNNIGTFVSGGGQSVNVLRAKLESDFKPGYGFHLATLASPWDRWRIGLTFRSQVTLNVDNGNATFAQIASGDSALDATIAANLPPGQTVTTELVFPAMASLGVAWDPSPDWTYEVDALWTQWSSFEKIPLRFPGDPSLDADLIEDYSDQFQVRAGAEHRHERTTYRLGYYFDQSPAPPESVTPILPDANRHGATVGIGLERGKWTVDAYNLFLFVEKRSTEGRERGGFDGVYKTYVNSLGASLTYRW